MSAVCNRVKARACSVTETAVFHVFYLNSERGEHGRFEATGSSSVTALVSIRAARFVASRGR